MSIERSITRRNVMRASAKRKKAKEGTARVRPQRAIAHVRRKVAARNHIPMPRQFGGIDVGNNEQT